MTCLDADDRSDLRRWILSSVAVAMLYTGVVAAITTWHQPDDIEAAEPSGAIVIDLAPEAAAPTTTPTDIAPGPEQTMSEARPTAKPQETPPDDTPNVPPATHPDAAVAPPEKPKVEETPQQQAAATTTAPPAVSGRVAPVAVAPNQGRPDAKNSEAVVTWRTQVLALIERNKRYPAAAQARREQGTAQVSFTLDRKGMVVDSHVTRSSGASALDEEAVALLKRAQPFPVPPANLQSDLVVVRLPIRFTVK